MRPLASPFVAISIALVSACSSTDAARRSSDQSAATSAATPAASPSRVASSSGTLGATTGDSISDRADRGRILGDSTAPVWLIMASDFQCPWCKRWHDSTFAPIVQNYVRTGKVRMAYLNFPLSSHKNAPAAAEAAMCASIQGKFWQMHDALFADQDKWSGQASPTATFDAMAARAGVAMPAWRECMTKHSTFALIAADRDRAAAAGVKSTPTFFVGQWRLEGAEPYATFRSAIDSALAVARRGAGKSPSP
jgi:protein-disulfide isomerase